VPVKIPNSLVEWTFDVVDKLISDRIFEGYKLDYKKDLPDSDTITSLCCAFANTEGGFIIFGIDDSSVFSIDGLKYDKEYGNKFGAKLKAEPEVKFSIKSIEIPKIDKYLYVFEIPKSDLSPHTNQDPEKRKFWKRGNGKKILMTLEEIRQSFQRELKVENNMLNQLIRESGLSEPKRQLKHKIYYIKRILSYYDIVIKNYNRFKSTASIFLPIPFLGNDEKINKLHYPLIRDSKIFFDSIKSFVDAAKEDIRKIEYMLNDPRIGDKFINVINESKKFIESYMFEENTKISLINIKDKKNLASIDEWMKAIEQEITFLKEEIK
jgi:hypothetical protein